MSGSNSSSDPKYAKIVREDFDILSKSYDRINNFMSLGTDRQFRYLAVKNLLAAHEDEEEKLNVWIDIGTGTGHLANEMFKQKPDVYIVAMDITKGMLEYSKEREAYQQGNMDLILGDAAKLPFRSASFDGGFSGFVGRHFTNYPKTLGEHYRIIRTNGRYSMLEMGRRATPLAPLVDVYVGQFMSLLGKLAAFIVTQGNAPFRLLEETYARFYSPKELQQLFEDAGFATHYKTGLVGSIVIMLGKRRPN